MGAAETRRAIDAAARAFEHWRRKTARERAVVLRRWFELTMANREDLAVLRIVVRNGFSHDLAALFLADLERLLPELERQAEPTDKELAVSFRH